MKKILFTFLLLSLTSVYAMAQTTIVFNVDLRAVMIDSTFIPDEDVIQIKGNLYPLGPNMPIKMYDEAPIDSIYTVELRFPGQHNGKELNFKFEIAKKRKTITDPVSRTLILKGDTITFHPLPFYSFIR